MYFTVASQVHVLTDLHSTLTDGGTLLVGPACLVRHLRAPSLRAPRLEETRRGLAPSGRGPRAPSRESGFCRKAPDRSGTGALDAMNTTPKPDGEAKILRESHEL